MIILIDRFLLFSITMKQKLDRFTITIMVSIMTTFTVMTFSIMACIFVTIRYRNTNVFSLPKSWHGKGLDDVGTAQEHDLDRTLSPGLGRCRVAVGFCNENTLVVLNCTTDENDLRRRWCRAVTSRSHYLIKNSHLRSWLKEHFLIIHHSLLLSFINSILTSTWDALKTNKLMRLHSFCAIGRHSNYSKGFRTELNRALRSKESISKLPSLQDGKSLMMMWKFRHWF